MEKEFIPYDLASELRNLGFDDYVFAFYWTDTKQLILDSPDYLGKHNGVHLQAPLWQQAFRFFRDEYNLTAEQSIEQYRRKTDKKWMYSITWLDKDVMYTHSKITYSTYEEAGLECLKKLIEIAKEQNVKYI